MTLDSNQNIIGPIQTLEFFEHSSLYLSCSELLKRNIETGIKNFFLSTPKTTTTILTESEINANVLFHTKGKAISVFQYFYIQFWVKSSLVFDYIDLKSRVKF